MRCFDSEGVATALQAVGPSGFDFEVSMTKGFSVANSLHRERSFVAGMPSAPAGYGIVPRT